MGYGPAIKMINVKENKINNDNVLFLKIGDILDQFNADHNTNFKIDTMDDGTDTSWTIIVDTIK